MFVASYVTATGDIVTLKPMPTEIEALWAAADLAAEEYRTFDELFPMLYDDREAEEHILYLKALTDGIRYEKDQTMVLIEQR